MIELRKSQSSGVLELAICGDDIRALHWIWREGPTGVQEHGKGQQGLAGNLGEPKVSLGTNTGIRGCNRSNNTLALMRRVPRSGERKWEPTRGIAAQRDKRSDARQAR